MDYQRLKDKLLYSGPMRVLDYTRAGIKGYISIGEFARAVSQRAGTAALMYAKIDYEYCEYLAIAKWLCAVPYRKSEDDEPLSGLDLLEHILGMPSDEKTAGDLQYFLTGSGEKSPEASYIERIEEILRLFGSLSREQLEAIGDDLLKSTLVKRIRQLEDGSFIQCELYDETLRKLDQ